MGKISKDYLFVRLLYNVIVLSNQSIVGLETVKICEGFYVVF